MAEKAGEIYYDIEADVSGLLKAQGKANKSLDSIGNSATNAAKKMPITLKRPNSMSPGRKVDEISVV